METLVILVKLLCAHLLSDFILQTDGINKGKRKPGIKGIAYQLIHATTHALAAYLFVAQGNIIIRQIIIMGQGYIAIQQEHNENLILFQMVWNGLVQKHSPKIS